MADSYIKIEGLDAAIRKCEKIGSLDIVKAGLKEAGTHVKGKIAQYPPRTYVPQPFVSARQKAFFFAALADGRIEVPYRRGQSPGSEDLGQRWSIKVQKGGLRVVVGNNAAYGPFVQGPDEQAWFMKARGWKTTDQIAEQESDNVNRIVAERINQALNRA